MNRLPTTKERNHLSPTNSQLERVDVMQTASDWRNSSVSIKEKLYNSLVTGCFSDIRFTVGQVHKREIPAHRFILFLNSSVFETLLEGSHLNKSVNVTVSDVEPEAFASFLKFLYTDEFDVHVKDATAVLYLSKKYDVPRLAVHCAEFIKNNISTKNVVSVLLSAEALGESSISIQARYFLRRNIRFVIHEEDFLQLNSEELCQLFASDELTVAELELFNAAVHWAIEECKRQKMEDSPQNYRFALKSVLPLIRFPLMDRKDFTLHVATKNILTDSECLNVMMHWDVTGKERASLPPLLFNNKPRLSSEVGMVNDALTSFQHYPAGMTMAAREPSPSRRDYEKSYYYDTNVQRGYRASQGHQGKPPPPPRRSNQVIVKHHGSNMQPFTYLPESSPISVPYATNYVDYGNY